MKTFSKTPSEKSFRNINCAVCGSSDSLPAWKAAETPFVKCRNCGLVYQNPQPLQAELLERYDDEYFEYEIENEENFLGLMKLGLADVDFFRIEAGIISAAEEKGETAAFMDIGCATGALLGFMKNRGWKVKGVEVCESAARYGIEKRGLDIYTGTLEAAGFAESSFDVVHSSHLIEHLNEPDSFVAEAARILKPGGRLIVVTPDISGFQAVLFRSRWRSAIDDHMYLFSKKTLSRMLEKHGFRLIKTVTWGGLAAGTAPGVIKTAADRIVKPLGAGDVVCIMGVI